MYLNALALKAQTIDHDAYTASSGGRVCCYETQKGGKRRKRKQRREKQEEVENNLSERNEEEEPAIGGGGREGWRKGWSWRRESDNRNVFSHRFTQAIALPFSPALINGIIEQCGIPFKNSA